MSMAAVSFCRLVAPSSLASAHASASSSASSQVSSGAESFHNPFWKGFIACGVARLICSSSQGFLGRTGLKKSCGNSSDVNASLKAFAAVLSSTFSTSEEADESIWGDFCPLYSSRDVVTFSSKLLPVRTICMSATKDKDILNSIEIDGLSDSLKSSVRTGRVKRSTKETNVDVFIGLDGNGCCECDTGIPFLDHMLDQLASHGLFDLNVKAKGDIHIDDHHTNEDVALALGTALLQALGDRKGVYRFGDFSAPLDEALVHVALDLSGRPHLGYRLEIPTDRVGTYDTQLVEHFFQSIVNTSGMTLHIRQISGRNSHHIIEATFKAFAKALRQAIEYDHRRKGTVPSSKGVLSRS